MRSFYASAARHSPQTDWGSARAFFEQAAAFGESAESLAGLDEALQFAGEHARAIELKERAFAARSRTRSPARGGCCIKPSRKSRCPLAEVGAREAEPTRVASRGWRVTNDLAVFGARP